MLPFCWRAGSSVSKFNLLGQMGCERAQGSGRTKDGLGTDLGFNFTLGVNRACRAGQAPPWSVPWDGRRAKRIFWLCRELSRARTRWYVHGCVHMCARVHACVRARAGKKARTRSTNRLQHSPVALSVSRSHRLAPRGPLHGTGASRPPAERAPKRAREVGLGGGREAGGRAGGRRIREVLELFDRSQGSRKGRGGPPGAARAAGGVGPPGAVGKGP